MSTSTLSTHVLDSATGRPAVGLQVLLDGIVQASTDDDGRVRFPEAVDVGPHRLEFATGPWFAAAGRETFFPTVVLAFEVAAEPHHHVALLLSPFAYTTYRGS